ncbi:hypothetical protein KNT75_gp81 [Gordonia phage Kabluna]|uniref:Uncharacterized protein n=1 Tax=Gordonia phage Kabluna TaxID=2041511 RepID=A0A2D1GD27_9CAUD|nr:hypothetical protein KNT75_gp81 [Gordonia phage Kabluna]ATN89602.1 hypothetical protein SEA_KABLUNA_81 [Gordonia phage Kabluna]
MCAVDRKSVRWIESLFDRTCVRSGVGPAGMTLSRGALRGRRVLTPGALTLSPCEVSPRRVPLLTCPKNLRRLAR